MKYELNSICVSVYHLCVCLNAVHPPVEYHTFGQSLELNLFILFIFIFILWWAVTSSSITGHSSLTEAATQTLRVYEKLLFQLINSCWFHLKPAGQIWEICDIFAAMALPLTIQITPFNLIKSSATDTRCYKLKLKSHTICQSLLSMFMQETSDYTANYSHAFMISFIFQVPFFFLKCIILYSISALSRWLTLCWMMWFFYLFLLLMY